MSARQWKIRLEENQRHLGLVETAAREWQAVAENRRQLLILINTDLKSDILALANIGEVFGCDPAVSEELLRDPPDPSGAELYKSIHTKLSAVAAFIGSLTREALSLQVTLDDVYTIAAEAVSPPRPHCDTNIDLGQIHSTSPGATLPTLIDEVNNLPPPEQSTDELSGQATDNSTSGSLVHRPLSLDALFVR